MKPSAWALPEGTRFSLRMRVPEGRRVFFHDQEYGDQSFITNRDFGDFVLWRHDDVPSYQLAVVSDDMEMQITEVVRGADLLVSTARQILIYEALQAAPPKFLHCPLVCDETGERLAKRHDALSLRSLREAGHSAKEVRNMWDDESVSGDVLPQ